MNYVSHGPVTEIPRLSPIERPRSLVLRLAYWISRRRFGRVITPLQVIYARRTALIPLTAYIDLVREKKLSVDPAVRMLVTTRVSQLNGCAFCHDLNLARAVQERLGYERFLDLDDWRESHAFNERERAALALADEITRHHDLSEPTFELCRRYFSDREIVELVWLCAVENYFNMQARSLRIGSDGLLGLATKGQTMSRRSG